MYSIIYLFFALVLSVTGGIFVGVAVKKRQDYIDKLNGDGYDVNYTSPTTLDGWKYASEKHRENQSSHEEK